MLEKKSLLNVGLSKFICIFIHFSKKNGDEFAARMFVLMLVFARIFTHLRSNLWLGHWRALCEPEVCSTGKRVRIASLQMLCHDGNRV